MARNQFQLRLLESRSITPSTRHFVLERTDGSELRFTPGQFIMTHFEMDGETHQRSYSLATMPGASPHYEISVSFVEGGRGTRLLWGLTPGDEVTASGPYGRFVLRRETVRSYFLVGTGTGVAPYRTMLPELRERIASEGLQVHLLLGVREPAELLYGEEFQAFANANPGFHFHACYSRVMPDNPPEWAFRGYVQQRLAAMNFDPQQDIAYLCGNPNMVDQAVEHLIGRGCSPFQIRREKYI
jgi:ferredoxin-NADP reductase